MNGYHNTVVDLSDDATQCPKFTDRIPPIALKRSTPTPEMRLKQQQLHLHADIGGRLLPQINPHTARTSSVSGEQVIVAGGIDSSSAETGSSWSPASTASSSDNCLYKCAKQIKEEPSSCVRQHSPLSLASNDLQQLSCSAIGTTGADSLHLRMSNGTIAISPSPSSALPSTTGPEVRLIVAATSRTGALKLETPASQHSLFPPITASHALVHPHGDLEEANPATLNPPLYSYSPYFGSGISETPSLPSIPNSSHQITRKRPLSSSPLPDLTSELTQGSGALHLPFGGHPTNPLVGIINPSSTTSSPAPPPLSPSVTSSSNIPPLVSGIVNGEAKGCHFTRRVHKQKMSIEQNHNIDGTTNMTITNQITICDRQMHKYSTAAEHRDVEPITHTNGVTVSGNMEEELMEFGSTHSRSPPDHHHHVLENQQQQHQHRVVKDEPTEQRICLWNGCGQEFFDLDDIVQHIENTHIEKGKMDDFTCMWQMCPRKCKPFNARYKLLIHMRIHSGEKPNKCTVSSNYLSIYILFNARE